jgi:hypothetical protein
VTMRRPGAAEYARPAARRNSPATNPPTNSTVPGEGPSSVTPRSAAERQVNRSMRRRRYKRRRQRDRRFKPPPFLSRTR